MMFDMSMRGMEGLLGALLLGIGVLTLYSLRHPSGRVADYMMRQNSRAPMKPVSARMQRVSLRIGVVLGPLFVLLGLTLLIVATT